MSQSLPVEKLAAILENQGYRELVSAHLFAGGVRLAPTIDDKHMLAEHAREELSHFESVSTLYEQVVGAGLYDIVAPRAASMPTPASWLEIAVAAYLVDRAAAVQLAAYQRLGDPRLETLIHKVLDHEHEHQTAAETALLDQCRGTPAHLELARGHVERWFPLARGVMDPGTKTVGAFADAVRPTLTACRLSVPSDPAA
ncbi:MAG TPA: ferritin-like fold-containing protein [Polyangiaceae bacterium]|jgi:1,2-phenylacetyl-CoA epoxidase catalytic subunit|nr:ferritin-like fold-containing protein [Polyangiaceae bacterium]